MEDDAKEVIFCAKYQSKLESKQKKWLQKVNISQELQSEIVFIQAGNETKKTTTTCAYI